MQSCSREVSMAPASESKPTDNVDVRQKDILKKADDMRKSGNTCCNKGSYADACVHYDKAVQQLQELESTDHIAQEVTDLNLTLHLNLALTYLRRGGLYYSASENVSMPAFSKQWEKALQTAIEHADAALVIDPENEKGFLRRGTARSRLSERVGYEELAELAVADLQKAIELNPAGKEAKNQLKQREERDGFTRSLESNPLIYLDKASIGSRRPVLSAQNVYCYHDSKEGTTLQTVLAGASLDLRAGCCIGIFGDSTLEKSALARVLSGRSLPSKGRIVHHGRLQAPPGAGMSTATWLHAAAAVGAIYLSALLGVDPWLWLLPIADGMTWVEGSILTALAFVILLITKHRVDKNNESKLRHRVVCLTGDCRDAAAAGKTVGQALEQSFANQWSVEEKREQTMLMLKAAGLKAQDDSTETRPIEDSQYDELSDGQKQVLHLLACMAARPDVLIYEEALCHVERAMQLRVLRMLRRMKEELGLSIVFISTELSHIQLIADCVGYLVSGIVSELGANVLTSPQHPGSKEYISSYQAACPAGEGIGGCLEESFAALAEDESLSAQWLPHHRT